MEARSRILSLLAELDRAARQSVASAATEGRFGDLEHLAPIAKDVAVLAGKWRADAETKATSTPSPDSGGRVTRRQARESRELTRTGAEQRAKPKKSDFPSFLRERQELVKLGWSPREKGPYEHRVERAYVDRVTQEVASKGCTGKRFAMEEILNSLSGPRVANPIPSYQIYAVMAWLKWSGMIIQHGRQGYNVVRPKTFAASVETSWQSLRQR